MDIVQRFDWWFFMEIDCYEIPTDGMRDDVFCKHLALFFTLSLSLSFAKLFTKQISYVKAITKQLVATS